MFNLIETVEQFAREIAAVYALRLYDLTDKQPMLTVVARWFDANDDLKEYAIAAWFTEV